MKTIAEYRKTYPHLAKILTKMTQMANGDVEQLDFSKTDWYRTYAWTSKTQQRFINWLVSYFSKYRAARFELMCTPSKSCKRLKEAAQFFNLMYGWPVREANEWYSAEGKPFLVRCSKCLLENYAAAVATGTCAHCGHKMPWKKGKKRAS